MMEAFYEGYKAIQSREWDFLVKLDADLTFDADYFKNASNISSMIRNSESAAERSVMRLTVK